MFKFFYKLNDMKILIEFNLNENCIFICSIISYKDQKDQEFILIKLFNFSNKSLSYQFSTKKLSYNYNDINYCKKIYNYFNQLKQLTKNLQMKQFFLNKRI
jgi:hypothetical protein